MSITIHFPMADKMAREYGLASGAAFAEFAAVEAPEQLARLAEFVGNRSEIVLDGEGALDAVMSVILGTSGDDHSHRAELMESICDGRDGDVWDNDPRLLSAFVEGALAVHREKQAATA